MSPLQQMFLGLGAVATKPYVDDVFSTYVYAGTGSSRSINNGINLSGEGGMTWIKNRGATNNHNLFDTERGATKYLRSNENTTETTNSDALSAFNSNGFSVVDANEVNASSNTYASWTFRKAPGFFDVVTWTGNGTAGRTISHSLGCIPGCIMIKATSHGLSWAVGHRSLNSGVDPWDKFLRLSNGDAEADDAEIFNDTAPTATNFTVGDSNLTNTNNVTYVAYVFAGGESTAATARSVNFVDGSTQTLRVANNADFNFGSGDFTVEGWFNIDHQDKQHGCAALWGYANSRRSWIIQTDNSANGPLEFAVSGTGGNSGSGWNFMSGGNITPGQWYHFAAVRDGSNLRLFLNGEQVALTTGYSGTLYNNTDDDVYIGSVDNNTNPIGDWMDGNISNIRITKGQALYTTAFKVPTEPLTTTSQGATASNVKLLCCNNSSTTGSTVTSGTITALNSPTASTDSPFDDAAGFVFGENEDQNVIKCGSYVGNGSSTGPEINLGWEPQWIMLKRADTTGDWFQHDSMRGMVTGGNDPYILLGTTDPESGSYDLVDLTPTGFKITTDSSAYNANEGRFIYMCLRRPDGYVGKPAKVGTDVFAMDTGAGTSTLPVFDSGFPVDLAWYKGVGTSSTGILQTGRLTQGKYLSSSTNGSQVTFADFRFDSNVGWDQDAVTSAWQSWMWKRASSFTMVTYKGDGIAGRQITHDLGPNNVPEMIWIKRRDTNANWRAYHIGLNNGVNPQDYALRLNTGDAQNALTDYWGDTAFTSTHFQVGSATDINAAGSDYIAMLFSSVTGISKCGYYSGSNSSQTISLGFQPRFVIIRATNTAQSWIVLDTLRGWGSGDDEYLQLNESNAQASLDLGTPTSTGMTLVGSESRVNYSGNNYIYYAHA